MSSYIVYLYHQISGLYYLLWCPFFYHPCSCDDMWPGDKGIRLMIIKMIIKILASGNALCSWVKHFIWHCAIHSIVESEQSCYGPASHPGAIYNTIEVCKKALWDFMTQRGSVILLFFYDYVHVTIGINCSTCIITIFIDIFIITNGCSIFAATIYTQPLL